MNAHHPRSFAFAAVVIACMAMSARLSARADNANAIVGAWLTEGGKSRVVVSRLGKGFTGKIVWLRYPNYIPADRDGYLREKTDAEYRALLGKPKRDGFNPDPSKRRRPVLGLAVLSGFTYSGDNVWEEGEIYNPEEGKTYRCKLTLEGNRLNVRGFIGVALFGKTTVWTRAAK